MACSADWLLNGVSCYKENDKDTWEGARQGCTVSGCDLVKVDDDDNQKRFLIHFMEVRSALVNIRRKALLSSVGFRKRMTSRSPRSLICDSSVLRLSVSDLFDFW